MFHTECNVCSGSRQGTDSRSLYMDVSENAETLVGALVVVGKAALVSWGP